jgi:xanthine/CO dehydrogenase XdhC/CoxF family maturation factor
LSELIRIAQALAATQAANEPSWLASVVSVEGSAYRRPGARLLFGRDGALAGSISGGCLDSEVARSGAWLCRHGAALQTYDSRPDEDGAYPRAGCGGRVTLLLEPMTSQLAALLERAAAALAAERRVLLATVVHSDQSTAPRLAERWLSVAGEAPHFTLEPAWRELAGALHASRDVPRARVTLVPRDGWSALVETLDPAPSCFVFGTGEDAVPLVSLLRSLDWKVTVCSERSRFSTYERFVGLARVSIAPLRVQLSSLQAAARPLAVVMNHDYERDREALQALLGSDALYIGVLGPARRTERMLRELGPLPARAQARLTQVHGPVGLDLGAETPAEIALAIAAEMQAVLTASSAGFLRERRGGIHPAEQLHLLEAESA